MRIGIPCGNTVTYSATLLLVNVLHVGFIVANSLPSSSLASASATSVVSAVVAPSSSSAMTIPSTDPANPNVTSWMTRKATPMVTMTSASSTSGKDEGEMEKGKEKGGNGVAVMQHLILLSAHDSWVPCVPSR